MTNKNDKDVKAIWISNANTNYIPENLGYLFNLSFFVVGKTYLIEIKARNFDGMQDLTALSLTRTKITSIPANLFSTLTKLRHIDLDRNEISELPRGLFDSNLNLEEIHLMYNNIKFIAPGLFDKLTKLENVFSHYNVCIVDSYFGYTAINELKNVSSWNCSSNANANLITTKTFQ